MRLNAFKTVRRSAPIHPSLRDFSPSFSIECEILVNIETLTFRAKIVIAIFHRHISSAYDSANKKMYKLRILVERRSQQAGRQLRISCPEKRKTVNEIDRCLVRLPTSAPLVEKPREPDDHPMLIRSRDAASV